ncbi:MAG: phospholipase D family protein [Desulfomonilaceae bacterium]
MDAKRTLGALVVLFVLAGGSTSYTADLVINNAPAKVLFNPGGRCTEAIIEEINSAETEILVQAYSFTSRPIANALVEAHKRGVDVHVIIDERKSTTRGSQATFLAHHEIPTYIDGEHPPAHNKVIIIDGKTVITGSFDLTSQAEISAENLLIIKCSKLAKLYAENWMAHGEDSPVLAPEE